MSEAGPRRIVLAVPDLVARRPCRGVGRPREGVPLLSVAETLRQNVNVSGEFAMTTDIGTAPGYSLPRATFLRVPFGEVDEEQVFEYVPVPGTAKPPPGVVDDGGRLTELAAAFGVAVSVYEYLLPGSVTW